MNHHEIIEAVTEAPPGSKCISCDDPATKLWPVTTLKQEQPYCEKCLGTAQHRLLVAVGVASIGL